MQIMIAERGINRNMLVAPNAGLAVPYFPVIDVVAVVNDVPSEADKSRSGGGNRLHQRHPYRRIRGVGVFRIVKARVAISDEVEWGLHVGVQINRCRLGARFLRAARQCQQNRGRKY